MAVTAIVGRCVCAAILAFAVASNCQAQTLYSFYWLTNPQPCGGQENGQLLGPVVSSFYPACTVSGTPVSICPATVAAEGSPEQQPWSAGVPITIRGYDLTCIVSNPQSQCVVELGSGGAPAPGADVFARTGGVGTNHHGMMFGSFGIPQGHSSSAHIDGYAQCDGEGTFAILATVFYTSP